MENILDSALSHTRTLITQNAESSQEAAWVAASQRGDAVSFNRLVLKWERPIYNLSLRMLRDEDEAASCRFTNVLPGSDDTAHRSYPNRFLIQALPPSPCGGRLSWQLEYYLPIKPASSRSHTPAVALLELRDLEPIRLAPGLS